MDVQPNGERTQYRDASAFVVESVTCTLPGIGRMGASLATPRDTTSWLPLSLTSSHTHTMQRMDNTEVTTPLTSTSQFIEAGEQPVC